MTTLLIYFWVAFYCQAYDVDLPFALAVAHIESRGPGQEFRTGLLAGRWYGPFNIHRDFIKKWPDIDTLEGNCRRGVASLRLAGLTKRQRLKKYNASFTEVYYQAVRRAERKYQRRLIEYRRTRP